MTASGDGLHPGPLDTVSFDSRLYCLKIDQGTLKWRIQPVNGSEIASSPQTDGRRIVLAMRRKSEQQGQNAVVAIGEDQGKAGGTEKPGR
jgi:hypothetical protein